MSPQHTNQEQSLKRITTCYITILISVDEYITASLIYMYSKYLGILKICMAKSNVEFDLHVSIDVSSPVRKILIKVMYTRESQHNTTTVLYKVMYLGGGGVLLFGLQPFANNSFGLFPYGLHPARLHVLSTDVV